MSTTNRSEAQIAASRSNGSKSNGPTTPEGKSKVKYNRVIHGFRGNALPLSTEDRAPYDLQLQLSFLLPTLKILLKYHPQTVFIKQVRVPVQETTQKFLFE